MKFNSCVLVGLGGTGSQLLGPLKRLLYYHENGTWDIHLVDGDSYEAKNFERQLFPQGGAFGNKALVQARDPGWEFVTAHPYYLTSDNIQSFMGYLTPPVLFIAAVDRMKSRKLFFEVLSQRFKDFCWICPGNEYDTAQVSIHIRQQGQDLTTTPIERYESMRNPQDGEPGDCIEEQESSPQLVTANTIAACITMMYVDNILNNRDVVDETIGSIRRLTCKNNGSKMSGFKSGAESSPLSSIKPKREGGLGTLLQ